MIMMDGVLISKCKPKINNEFPTDSLINFQSNADYNIQIQSYKNLYGYSLISYFFIAK